MKEIIREHKKFFIIFALILFLVISGLIGQLIIFPIRERGNGEKLYLSETEDTSLSKESDCVIKIEWINQRQTNDNPWGLTADIIDIEENEAIFLTPGTAIKIRYHVTEEDSLQFQYYIHPWVAEVSDGLELSVNIEGADKQFLEINREDNMQIKLCQLDVSDYHGKDIDIKIENLLKDGNDLSGDWLIIK